MTQFAVATRFRLLVRAFDRLSPNSRGIGAMLGAMASFAIGDAMMKLLAGHMPLGETLFVRGVMASAVIWYVAARSGVLPTALSYLHNRHLRWRTMADVGGSFFYIAALGRVPLADAAAILQTNPLAVTAGAAVFLGERVGWRRWTATAIGFLGVLLIIQPGSSTFTWASVLVIVAVTMSASRDLLTRPLTGIPTVLVTACAASATTICSLALLPFETWKVPALLDVARLALAGIFMLTGQVLVVISIRSGDVSTVVPFRYSAILWTLLLSVLIWGYLPNKTTLLGIVIVSGAGLYTFFREQSLRRQGRL